MSFFRAKGRENQQEALSAPLTRPESKGIIPSASFRPGLEANDGLADDFIALAENWQGSDGEPILSKQPPAAPKLGSGLID